MSELTTSIFDAQGVLASPSFRTQLVDLLSPIWQEPEKFLDESFSKIDRILLGQNESGKILGFMTWRVQKYSEFAALYAGLGAIDTNFQGKGLGKEIIHGGIKAGAKELNQQFPNLKRYIWTTTGSPIAYLGLLRQFPEGFNPQSDGVYDKMVLPMLEEFKSELGLDAKKDHHPFILKGFSSKRYTPEMHLRLSRVNSKEKIPLFDANGFDERNGDRVILVFSSL